ncbi:MAG TPA: isochorismatase family cysteine hydrolase [Gemmatimonadaceae bacterium]|nr:isochorismatase family cysteine hydrolase [Gemmatimonadaceae bacterium]
MLTVDFQSDFLSADGPCYCAGGQDALQNALKLADACRVAGIPVVHVMTIHEDRASVPRRDRERDIIYCIRGSAGAEPALGLVEPNDIVVTKNRYDAYYGTDLSHVLQKLGTTEVLLVGLKSTCCVLAAGLGTLDREFALTVVRDACAPPAADVILQLVFDKGSENCQTVQTSALIARLTGQDIPFRREIAE